MIAVAYALTMGAAWAGGFLMRRHGGQPPSAWMALALPLCAATWFSLKDAAIVTGIRRARAGVIMLIAAMLTLACSDVLAASGTLSAAEEAVFAVTALVWLAGIWSAKGRGRS